MKTTKRKIKVSVVIPAFKVVEQYLEREVGLDGKKILDLNSRDGIWGIETGIVCEKSTIFILNDKTVDAQRGRNVQKNLDANFLANASIISPDYLMDKDVGAEEVDNQFDLVIYEHQWSDNPLSVQNTISEVWEKINFEGKFLIVSHKKAGAESLLESLKELGLRADIIGRGRGGVRLIEIVRKPGQEVNRVETSKNIDFDFLGKKFKAITDKAVFAPEGVDKGTNFLLETVLAHKAVKEGGVVDDVGCGWGAISLIISRFFPGVKIVAFENNPKSIELAEENLKGADFTVEPSDITDLESEAVKNHLGEVDIIVSNPPFHVTERDRGNMFKNMKKLLKKSGELWFVVEESFANRFKETAGQNFNILNEYKSSDGKYFVLHCKK